MLSVLLKHSLRQNESLTSNRMKKLFKKVDIVVRTQKGFAMLFAVLASSIVLAIGLSIFNLTIKELTLSSSGRESQIAFYAADTGAECALYWNFKSSVSIFQPPSLIASSTPDPVAQVCIGKDIAPTVGTVVGSTTTYIFTLPMAESTGGCASVTVKKIDTVSGIVNTVIDSRGYNTNDCDSTDEDKVERGIKVTF